VRITLREISDENEPAVRALRTTAAQERFVSTVEYSLREAERNPQDNPWCRAIHVGEQPVGFVMVAWDIVPAPPDRHGPFFLWKLLIDHQHQGKGYGREAVEQVIALVRADGAEELLTSCVDGEGSPLGFYTRLGFVPRGDLDPDGEIMLRLVV
jgi:GNAT superfamily N-acetyltransferase